ncbi:MAG: ATPase [Actinomycetales bacterium]|nr:ATPase [Actinomycetales bacterium]
MPVIDVVPDPEARTITLTADLAAPVERVWRAMTDPRQLERFWGPPTWPATFEHVDLRVGGTARYFMTGPNGEYAGGKWEFLEINEPHGYTALDHFVGEDGEELDGMPAMRMVLELSPTDDGTRMVTTHHFDSVEALEQVVAMGHVEGSTLAINQLDRVLLSLREFAEGKGTQVELLTDTLVRVTRLIEGPRELVWRAHHEEELLRRWMLGPDGWEMTYCSPATEAGQSYRWGWRNTAGEGEEFGFEGEALLIEPPRRSVTTERMVGMDGPGTVNDMTLVEEDGATLLTLVITYPDRETRDMILATGMTDGMEASYARLESTLAPV